MTDLSTDAAIRAFAAQRKYSPTTVDRWQQLASADGGALLDLARELRLGENQLRDLWDWAEAIAARDGLALAQVFTSETVTAARRRPLGRNDKLKLIKAALRRLRFPELTAVEERLLALVRELALPRNVRVTLPQFLEGEDLHVEIVADSPASLRAAVACLQEAATSRTCEAIFALLGEAP